MTTFINTTPHAITIITEAGEQVIPPCDTVARVSVSQERVADVAGIPTFVNKYGAVEGMPEPAEGQFVLVSAMVLAQLDRQQWSGKAFAPDTGKTAIRNEQGQIVAVTQLVGI